MFYVGDVLWLEENENIYDIPDFKNFSGCFRRPSGTKECFDKGEWQSFQDPVTKEWLPADSYADGTKYWYDKGKIQSFQNPVTLEWMPAIIEADGRKYWLDEGKRVDNPKTYCWKEKIS